MRRARPLFIRMRILQVVPYFSWESGGPVRVVYDLAHELAKRDNEVVVYTTDVGPLHRLNEREKIQLDSRIKIHYFRCVNNWIAQKWRLQLSGQMVSAFRSSTKDFDIIHTHEARGFHNVCVWHYARKYGVPYVFQAHGALPTALEQQAKTFVLAKYLSDTLVNRRVVRDAAKAIALTQSEALLYEQLGVERNNVTVVPNGIDLSQFEELPARGEFRARYNIAGNEKLILFLGRIHKTKGIGLLLTAFSGLCQEVDDVKLAIVGPDYGYLARVKEDIKHLGITDRTVLPGPLYGNAKLEAYVDADAYVLPSSYDMFPLSPIEACACGTPTIVTNRSGVADAIERVGCVIDYDAGQLQSAMYAILTNAELREKMKRKGPAMVKERYDIVKIVDNVEKLYRACI